MIGYSTAVKSLCSGNYDRRLFDGLNVIAAIQEGVTSGWYRMDIEKEIIIWRWLVATVFINEELFKNGTVDIPNEDGGTDTAVIYCGKEGGLGIYPGPLRFSLANHVEGTALEKYGRDLGLDLALKMYKGMIESCPQNGLRMSAMGRDGLCMLHDGFIRSLQTEGMPAMPVIH
ncbi:hypothetical protein CIG19_18810 [Enterobacterales bacterium CwR94]|nr:hypothetical protein CIG19_18810 [Enterobacterales bacterium CwR94]